jgi:phosphatidate cytidylyltransferase
MKADKQTLWLIGGVVALLAVASLAGWVLSWRAWTDATERTIQNFNARIRAWWVMVAVFGLALATGGVGSLVLFGLTSFWALREFITLTPTRRADHRTLFWVFFVITPLQYYLLAIHWYGLFVVFIPVYAFLFIPMRNAIAGDCEHFLERTAKVQWGLMICVYCVSHAPALLTLQIPGYEGQNGKLLFYFVLIDQISDVFQYVWGNFLENIRSPQT